MELEFSSAKRDDIAELAGLLAILFEQETEFHPDHSRQERGLTTIMEDPTKGKVFTARVNGQCVGMVILLFTTSTALGAPVAWLEDLVVMPEVRGRGIGGRLLDFAIDVAQRHGCARITLLTDADNEAAQKLYANRGFARSSMIPYRRSLTGSSTE